MDVVSRGPFGVSSCVWPSAQGGWSLTVVCRATYLLAPGESPIHPDQQEPPNEEDTYWDDDPRKSLSSASDLVPFKPRADVVLVGSAFAPRGEPARSIVARLLVHRAGVLRPHRARVALPRPAPRPQRRRLVPQRWQ